MTHNNKNSHYRFIIIFSKSLLLFFTCTILLEIFFDPYTIFQTPTIEGFTNHKPLFINKMRLTTSLQLTRKKPQSIILGTSRALSLTQSDVEQQSGHVFLNCGLCAASFDEIHAYFLHALYVQPKLKNVIIGIDLFTFNKVRLCEADFSENRLQRHTYYKMDYINSLFSKTAIMACCRTLQENLKLNQTLANFFGYKPEISLIDNRIKMTDQNYLRLLLVSDDYYKNYEIGRDKLKKIKEIVDICKEKSIDLKLYISPVKAMYWEFYFQNGLWPSVEKLKKEICVMHPIWDFSGYTPVTTEIVFNSNEPLYSDCSHFTPYVGKMLLKIMYENQENSDLGCLLTPDNIDTHLKKILVDRQKWIQGPGKDINMKFNDHNNLNSKLH